MYNYDTVSEAVNDLSKRGFTDNLRMQPHCLYCDEKDLELSPHEFEIVEVYRFEGNTDPSDEAVVYAVEDLNGGHKGVLVTGYGISAEGMSAEMVKKLKLSSP